MSENIYVNMNAFIRFMLFFIKKETRSVPISGPWDEHEMIVYKTLFGREYVYGQYKYFPPPEHWNCRCGQGPE